MTYQIAHVGHGYRVYRVVNGRYRQRYQAHPVARDEHYELRPASTRRDLAVTILAGIGLVACYLAASLR